MEIIVENYILEQEGNTFNLYWNKPSNSYTMKTEETGKKIRVLQDSQKERKVELGYNMTLLSCLRKIVMNELSNQDLKVGLEKWLELYKEENKKFEQTFMQLKLF